jgi:ADP-heptose:LPS heptosyltransferase
MHLAAAVGTPLVALFGPTDPARTGPWGEGHQVLRPAPEGEAYPDHRSYKQMDASFIAGIPVDEVTAAVVRAVGQSSV